MIDSLIKLQKEVHNAMDSSVKHIESICDNYRMGLITKKEYLHQISDATTSYAHDIFIIRESSIPAISENKGFSGTICIIESLNN